MKYVLLAATALFFAFGFAFTAGAIHEIIPSESQIPEPGPDALKLNEYIIKYDPYRAWQLWPDKGRLYKGSQPHGALLTTFVNNAAYFSLKQGKGMADRSIIVKENYTADKKFIALSVMYKIKGYNPAAGDWFWAKYSPDGKVEASGKVTACIDCHARQSANDHIFTGKVK
ncbi:MAG: cytochrome P460 family protein [Thermodesulfovibrionales bacterium]